MHFDDGDHFAGEEWEMDDLEELGRQEAFDDLMAELRQARLADDADGLDADDLAGMGYLGDADEGGECDEHQYADDVF